MPELPEVESARRVIEAGALRRPIRTVDDSDTYECRPHGPGEINAVLEGRSLVATHRRGKLMWCETSDDGPILSLHLGMSGRIFVTDEDGYSSTTPAQAEVTSRYNPRRPGAARTPAWDRFTISFEDGGALRLFDKRRLGRVRLDPDLSDLGPDAAEISRDAFRTRIGRGTAPLKARLLNQSSIAGIGNLLADEVLWQSQLSPQRPAGDLTEDELDELRRQLRAGIRSAIKHGGVHTGEVISHRRRGAHCPRCGEAMTRATVGGRTTWWCPAEQV